MSPGPAITTSSTVLLQGWGPEYRYVEWMGRRERALEEEEQCPHPGVCTP